MCSLYYAYVLIKEKVADKQVNQLKNPVDIQFVVFKLICKNKDLVHIVGLKYQQF